MALDHGNKRYYQILLDKNRAQLIEEAAEASGQRATALMREIIYEYMSQTWPEDIYAEALEADKEQWRQSVRNRVAGRMAKKSEPEPAAKTKEPKWARFIASMFN